MAILGMLRLSADEPTRATIFLYSTDEGVANAHPSVMLHELSAVGVLLETEHRLRVDQAIQLVEGSGSRWDGHIIWAGERFYACRFDPEIAADALAAINPEHISQREFPHVLAKAHADESFGARLQRLRVVRGLGQADLARKLGISPVAVSHWESGKSAPRPHRIVELSKILGVSEENLAVAAHGSTDSLSEAVTSSKNRIASVLNIDASKVHINVEL